MPTLNWIGRKAVENHHRQVAFHLLKDVPELSVGDLARLRHEGIIFKQLPYKLEVDARWIWLSEAPDWQLRLLG